MASHFEATLLPPPSHLRSTGSSSQSLDEIGAVTVLGAMVEQRRRNSSLLEAYEGQKRDEDERDEDAVATQKREAIDPSCDAFIKIR